MEYWREKFYGRFLMHQGVKGMKWGVRNGPPYPLDDKKKNKEKVEKSEKPGIIKRTIYGHQNTPRESAPNSITDHVGKNGKVDTRTIYGDNGLISKQIHTTDHGNPKWHKRGLNGEHVHVFEWNDDGTYKGKTERELSTEERKEHSDIL